MSPRRGGDLLRITRVTATVVSIPRTARLTLAYGSRDDATTVLVTLETDAGLLGIGQTPVDPPQFGAAGIKTNIETYLAPILIGRSPLDIEALHRALWQALPGHRATIGAIDLALWDLAGKALGVPVYQLLGGRLRDGVALMAMVTHADPETMARATDDLLRRALYPVLKVKIGMGAAEDLARYRAVREAAGERATIQVDGNRGYSLGQALAALGAMERLGGLGMIEQPVARVDDLAALARHFAAPVMVDESLEGPDSLIDIVTRGAAQAAFLKITKHGGILPTLKIAAIAEAAGIDCSLAIYYDVLAAAAAHLATALPAITWPSFVTRLADSILTEPIMPGGLTLRPPTGPGLGVTLDAEKVRRYTVER